MKRLALVLLLASFSFAQQSDQPAAKRPLTVEALYGGAALTGRGPDSLKWSPDGNIATYLQRDPQSQKPEIWQIDTRTGQKSVFINADKLGLLAPPATNIRDPRELERRTRYNVAAYHWSPDNAHILFDANGFLWYFRLDNGTAVQLLKSPESVRDPKFSPNGKMLGFIRKHNLVTHDIADNLEYPLTHTDAPKPAKNGATEDADDDLILNGDTDWVYPEELSVRSNYFWSPDSRHIAYLQMDETNVPRYPLVDYIPQHPNVDRYHYPKAGDVNPTVRLGVIGAHGSSTKWIDFGDALKDAYLPRFGWLSDNWMYAEILNRHQNRLDLYFIDINSGKASLVLSEKSDPFLELNDDFRQIGANEFTWASWRDGHTHLYLYSYTLNAPTAEPAKLVRQLTKGDFEVQGIGGIDEKAGVVYYLSNEGDDREEHLYSVKLDGSSPAKRMDTQPGVHGANFNPQATYYIHNWSNILSTPTWELCKAGGDCTKQFGTKDVPKEFALSETKWMDFKADDGTVLHGMMYLPNNAATAAAKSIPVILQPYGGPHGQRVRNLWSESNLYNMLLAQHGMAVLIVDNRGMNNRGKKFAEVIYGDMGRTELKDQLASLDQAAAAVPQLDAANLGIWGWSYGGYMTSYSMTHSERFTCGVAGAPVTDWHLYDSIYTERYMNLPQDNEKGYNESSAAKAAKNLHGKLLIERGTSDDNVHMQNDIWFIEQLVLAGKRYDYNVYPRKTHGITGTAERVHLWNRVLNHFEGCLLGK